MSSIHCHAGRTSIRDLLIHASQFRKYHQRGILRPRSGEIRLRASCRRCGIFGTISALVGLAALFVINRFFIAADKRRVVLCACAFTRLGWVFVIFLITPQAPWLTLIPVRMNAVGVFAFWLLIGYILADVLLRTNFAAVTAARVLSLR